MITNGNDADVILAQSIGGGGGKGGDAIRHRTLASAFRLWRGGGAMGGNGGNINVTNSGIIEVAGDHSDGVFAQSIGGGGGDGGEAFTFGLVAGRQYRHLGRRPRRSGRQRRQRHDQQHEFHRDVWR